MEASTMLKSGVFIILSFGLLQVSPILLKDWGTDNHINRLAYATYDVFSEAFQQITASLDNLYPVPDLTKTFSQNLQTVNDSCKFNAYNGWLDNMKLDSSNIGVKGNLRRLIMRSFAHNALNSESHMKHEIYICTSCLSITFKGFHFGYEAVHNGKEISGVLSNTEPLEYEISFTMTTILDYNGSKMICNNTLNPFTLDLVGADNETLAGTKFNARISKAKGFNFLADHIDLWMFKHFNTTVKEYIQQKLDQALRKALHHRDPCAEFLV